MSDPNCTCSAVNCVPLSACCSQSVRTAPLVLDAELPDALAAHPEVWIVTGTGHHTAAASHQRSVAGGVLHATVKEYLQENGYDFYVGRDNAGHSGAFLVRA